ncbi:MAG: T9SS type A sorting domain-containing protein [Bacteroidetes bacterium]|nr:T9SS type A sorting domain-containing protein [Bacteroidota bacterium]
MENFGPNGINAPVSSIKYSGRIADVEYVGNGSVRIVSASGGVWQMDSISPTQIVNYPISDNLDCNAGGAIATDPTNSNTIWVGTGEGGLGGGCGLYKTTDKGQSWTNIPLSVTPSACYHLILLNTIPQKFYLATNVGLYVSQDGGLTWTLKYNSNVSDVTINYNNPDIINIAVWGNGIFGSTDGGATWIKNTSAPATNFGRTALTNSLSAPNVIYASVTNNSDNLTKGIYKSNDDGATWSTCAFGVDLLGNPASGEIHWGQGWYNNIIKSDPNNSDLVVVGGGGLWRTTDGNVFNEVNVGHVDQHALAFASNGWVISGNDGGLFVSKNSGFSFNAINDSINDMQITQFVDMSVSKAGANTIVGGTQDNGVVYHTNASGKWATTGGDGGGVLTDPYTTDNIYYAVGVFGGNISFRRFISTNGMAQSADVSAGLDPHGDWYPIMRYDDQAGTLYTEGGPYIYRTDNLGATWSKENLNNPFNNGDIYDFVIDQSGNIDPGIYSLVSYSGGLSRIWVRDRNTQLWADRTAGIATSLLKGRIKTDPFNLDGIYVCIRDIDAGAVGKKVFYSPDQGNTWNNISGNLPNFSVTDILPSPVNNNIIYIATTEGAFRTLDGGTTWSRWSYGLPRRVEITQLDYVDSTAINGKLTIYASTYGRALWKRDASDDDPLAISNGNASKSYFKIYNPFPNPANDFCFIKFQNPNQQLLTVEIYNLLGKMIETLPQQQFDKGLQHVKYNTDKLTKGIYIIQINTALESYYTKFEKM